ncbi:MAG: CotH kinase family protein [Muribaculaceae bacterium]|nr:CotH kinase family protein [Muribaculaceae bacterium]
MKKLLFALISLVLLPLISCSDDELDALRTEQEALSQRVLALETWQAQVNENIASLKKLVESLEQRDYVTGVTPLNDGSGYIISFLNNGAIIIKNGIDGANGTNGTDGKDGQDGSNGIDGNTPVIGVKLGDDGIYYWTIDGEWLYDANGNKVRASAIDGKDGQDGAPGANGEDGKDGVDGTDGKDGKDGQDGTDGADGADGADGKDGKDGKDGNTPQLRINPTTNEWEVSTDNGVTWTSTGVKATGAQGEQGEKGEQGEQGEQGAQGEKGEKGDSWFAGVDTSNSQYITVTLTNGTVLTFPRYKIFKIGTDTTNEAIVITQLGATNIALRLPDGFKEADYTAIVANIYAGENGDIATRSYSSTEWIVKVNKPTFATDGTCNNDASVSITPPGNITAGTKAILNVTIINSDGSKTETARPLVMGDLNAVPSQVPHIYIMTDEYVEEIPDKENYLTSTFRVKTNESSHEVVGEISLRGRGNSTWYYDKRPYRLKFSEKVSICGMEASKNYVLIAHYIDPTLMSNPIAFKMADLLGMPYVNSAVPVEVTLNGKYRGAYMLTEAIGIRKTSVDIDEENSVLLEIDQNYDEEWQFRSPAYNLPVMVKDPDMTQELFNYWKAEFETLEQKLTKDSIKISNYADLLDLNSVADIMIINNMVGNYEIHHPKSLYMYKTKGDKFYMGPAWDYDWAYGFIQGEGYFKNEYPIIFGNEPNAESKAGYQLFRTLLTDPRFVKVYRDRWEYFRTYCYPQLMDYVDRYAALIAQSAANDAKIWTNTVNHTEMVEGMRQWLKKRITFIDNEMTSF